MPFESLYKVLSTMYPLSDGFRRALKKEMRTLSLPKNHFLNQPPEVADLAYFMASGFAMSYTFLDNKKVLELFWKPDDIILQPTSFFEQRPSDNYVQLMTDSKLLCISYQSVQKIFNEHSESQELSRIIMSRLLEKVMKRARDLQSLNSKERLVNLLVSFPDIEQIIPQELLASYIGITPQSLSRIKHQL